MYMLLLFDPMELLLSISIELLFELLLSTIDINSQLLSVTGLELYPAPEYRLLHPISCEGGYFVNRSKYPKRKAVF